MGSKSRGGTILVVDDDNSVRSLIASVLERSGYRVLAAADATSGLTMADAAEHRVDLVITDFLMPGIDGFEFANMLQGRLPGTPTLFISGFTEEREFPDIQISESLGKPFGPADLRRAVARLVREGRRARSGASAAS